MICQNTKPEDEIGLLVSHWVTNHSLSLLRNLHANRPSCTPLAKISYKPDNKRTSGTCKVRKADVRLAELHEYAR